MLLPTGTPAAVTVLVWGTEGEGSDGAEGAERVLQPSSVPRASTRRLPPGWFLPGASGWALHVAAGCEGSWFCRVIKDHGTGSGRGRAAPCC